MSNLEVSRSMRFVSLDTHPANNALVVTYEILVTVSDSRSGSELTRQTKRDQLQISVSALDKLVASDFKERQASGALNLAELSQTIIKKCALLEQRDPSQTLEEIQLHLLYLFNRKQSQLYQTAGQQEQCAAATSGRLRSATPAGSGGRLSSARQTSARDGRRSSLATRGEQTSTLSSCYTTFCERELKAGRARDLQPHDLEDNSEEADFLAHFSDYLSSLESSKEIDRKKKKKSSGELLELDAQLEGLYGELDEKIAAMSSIKSLVENDEKLVTLKPDKLLVTAILRTLQDSEARDAQLSGLILYCLIRFTQFHDVHERVFNQAGDRIDLLRPIVELLDQSVRLAAKTEDLRSLLSRFYHLNSPLVILNNLINLDERGKQTNTRRRLFQQHGKQVASSLVALFSILSRHLTRDLRNQSSLRYERLTLVLTNLIQLSRSLAIFREFVNLLRGQSQTLSESLISCINTLQLSRPGSGSNQQQQQQQPAEEQFFIEDQQIVCEVYQLEIELLKLINNLIYDARFKSRFSRKSLLLKCVLRNLVVFLASSRRSSSLAPFERSAVLLVPLKCLYELSCQQSIKEELYKSKIVSKCLLEYLLSCAKDLKTLLESLAISGRERSLAKADKSNKLLEDDQIILEANQAAHFVVAIWINLSAREKAPFFASELDKEICDMISNYIDLVELNLERFVAMKVATTKSNTYELSASAKEVRLQVYLHAKLLRNLSQHTKFHQSEPMLWASSYVRWVEQLARSIDELLSLVELNSSDLLQLPLAVECVACLANLISSADSLWPLEGEPSAVPLLDWPKELDSIIKRLLRINLARASDLDGGENDDLLLVSVNLFGALARCREICNELQSSSNNLITLCNLILETKNTDVEMLVSCLFTLCHLLNHWTLLKSVGSSLADERAEVVRLVDKLSALVMHGDQAIAKLANATLNTLKQFEEQHSLADSVAARRRFVGYNEKWLNAIRANRDEAGASLDGMDSELVVGNRSADQAELDASNDEFGQLRTVNSNGDEFFASSRISTSSSNRSSTLPDDTLNGPQVVRETPIGRQLQRDADDDDSEADGEEKEDEEEDDEEEETFSEPDVNVIDANSMIKHLTNRSKLKL